MDDEFDLDNELLVAEDFWDYLYGESVYGELLNAFEVAGIALKNEIDAYFDRF